MTRTLSLQAEGVPQAMTALAGAGERAANAKPALEASILHWQESERRRFKRGWKQSAEWSKEKRRRGLDARSMRATGRLEAALTNANRGDGVEARATRTTLVVGVVAGRSDIYYARALARGKPRRQSVTFDRQAKTATAETVMHYLTSGQALAHP